MKMNKLFLVFGILLSLALFASFVSAEANITYNKVYYGIIENDGSLTISTTAIGNFATEGYVCNSANCASIDSSATVPGLTRATSTSEIMLTYPTTLQGNGYVVYFFKDGYIGWEQRNITWAGTGEMNSSQTIYLSRKRSGYAPIMNLSVVNEAAPNQLIEINVTAGVDADTYAAIKNASLAGVPLNEEVNTTVLMRVLNSAGGEIYRETQNFLIPYSSSRRVSFNYAFASAGAYTVEVTTNVTDAKILTSIPQTESASVNVVQPNLTNYTYALVQNLQVVPANPNSNQTANFSFNWLANHDNGSVLTPVNATLYINITREGNPAESFITNLQGSSTGYQNYNFSRTFTQNGSYTITVLVVPNSTLGNQSFSSSQSLVFNVGDTPRNITPEEDDDDDDVDDDSDEDEESEKVLRGMIYTTKPANETALTLKAKPSLTLFQKLFYWLIVLIIILLVAVILVYIIKFVL